MMILSWERRHTMRPYISCTRAESFCKTQYVAATMRLELPQHPRKDLPFIEDRRAEEVLGWAVSVSMIKEPRAHILRRISTN